MIGASIVVDDGLSGRRVRPRVMLRFADRSSVAVIAAAAIATAWAATLLWRRIDGLATAAYDLGFFQQVVWNVGTSGAWISSFHTGSFLGLHFSPILVVPAVLQRIVGFDPHVLSLLHAIALGGLVVSAFLFLRAILHPSRWGGPAAALIAIGIPLWPTAQWVVRSDFHPELVGVVLALLAGWAGVRDRPWLMWAFAAVALLTREDVAYALIVVGIAIAARGRGRMRTHGWVLAMVAGTVGIVIFLVVMPLLRAGAPSETASYYAWLGSGAEVLAAPVLQAERVLAAIARPEPWLTVIGMIIGLAGLPLLRPRWLLPVGPPFLALVLSNHVPQATLIAQYPVLLVVPLVVAAGMGGRRALAFEARWRRGRSPRAGAAAAAAMGATLAVAILFTARLAGPLPPFSDRLPDSLLRASGIEEARAVAIVVPADAPVVADEGLVAVFANRHQIWPLTREGLPPADAYVIVDRAAWVPSAVHARERARIVSWLQASPRRIVADDGRFVVWASTSVEDQP